jgi:hypothetical protein
MAQQIENTRAEEVRIPQFSTAAIAWGVQEDSTSHSRYDTFSPLILISLLINTCPFRKIPACQLTPVNYPYTIGKNFGHPYATQPSPHSTGNRDKGVYKPSFAQCT